MCVVLHKRWSENHISISIKTMKHRDIHRREIVISVIPSDFACSYIRPSTSLDTALVHSGGKRSLD
jgi:hypothetical protein